MRCECELIKWHLQEHDVCVCVCGIDQRWLDGVRPCILPLELHGESEYQLVRWEARSTRVSGDGHR